MSADRGRRPATKGTSRSDAAPADARLRQALQRHQGGDLTGAEALYRRLLLVRPQDAEVLHLLGLVCAQTGRTEEALPLMRKALDLKSDLDPAGYNLGNVLLGLGRVEEAAAAYEAYLARRPDHPGAVLNLGVALRRLGKAEAAVEVCERALALRPQWLEARYNLGCALQQLGRHYAAAEAYREVLSLNPQHWEALANLGAALVELSQPADAASVFARWANGRPAHAEAPLRLSEALLAAGAAQAALGAARRALALDPEDVRARQQLGNALLETGEIEAAIAAYRGALERSPRQASLWVNLAVGLQQFGDLGGALGAVDAALQLDPGSGAAWAVRAGLKRFAADDPDLAALSRLLAAPKLLVEDRTRVEFALGKAFDDIGDAQKAFAHLTTGNRLHRSAHPYNVSGDLEQFAEIARALSPQTFSTLSGAGDPSRRPVFIVGMPRSGTSLVEQILASHPDVWGGGEQTVLERLLIERTPRAVSPLERARSLRDLQVSDLSSLGSDYVAEISKISSGALRVTDKMPLNFRFVGLIHLILPNAQIVHCRRDPLDTCLSCFAQNFSRGQDWSYDLEDLGRYHRGYERLMSHWREQTPPGRLLEISYEALVADLEGESRRLLAFCGLPWDSACLSFHETRRQVRTASVAQVRQPIYPRSVGRAVRYRPYLGPLMAALNL